VKARIESLINFWVKPSGSPLRPLLSQEQAENCGADRVRVKEAIEVEIRDLSGRAPDAVITYRHAGDAYRAERFYANGSDRYGKAQFLRSCDSFSDEAGLGKLMASAGLYSFDRRDLEAVKKVKRPPASRIVYSDEADVVARWRERISDGGYAVADNLFLRGFGEPTIMLRVRPQGELEIQGPATPRVSPDSRGIAVYRLDEWDRLQADVALLDAPSVDWGDIESMDVKPGVMKADAIAETISLAARYIVNAVGDRIYTLHSELLDDYADLYFHCNPKQSHHRDDVHEDLKLDAADVFAAASRLATHIEHDVVARHCLALIKTAMEASISPAQERLFDQAPSL